MAAEGLYDDEEDAYFDPLLEGIASLPFPVRRRMFAINLAVKMARFDPLDPSLPPEAHADRLIARAQEIVEYLEAGDAADRRSQLAGMPYLDYLQTPEWQAKRASAVERAEGRCQLCNRPPTTCRFITEPTSAGVTSAMATCSRCARAAIGCSTTSLKASSPEARPGAAVELLYACLPPRSSGPPFSGHAGDTLAVPPACYWSESADLQRFRDGPGRSRTSARGFEVRRSIR
jgi:hypothetical protein